MFGAPFNFATFLASICLIKNPDDEGRNLIGMFNNTSRLYQFIDKKATEIPNSLWRRANNINIVPEAFVDPHLSVYENYKRIDNFMRAVYQSGGTNISSIPEDFKKMADQNPEIMDALKNYPVWCVVSDCEWNNLPSPEASMNDFMRKCEDYFGYRPFIIAIDVSYSHYSQVNVEQFSRIDNFLYVPGNPEIIEQILINFKDMDRFDIYTPLQSVYRSNRYEIVRANVI